MIIIVAVGALALVGGLASLALKEPPGADAENPELVRLGGNLYGVHCAACHGKRLEGQANWRSALPAGGLPAPPHDASGHTWHHPDRLLFDYTKKGGQAMAPKSFKSNMPGFGATLPDRDIWAILSYIKSQWPADIRARQARLNK
jgi:mono/diheme cytochrome c family protein